ncbi:MAG: anthranilate/aminodeoxychorismate synthase component II [Omnitrophica WOR_2 bacterium RIFCSPHIGHO2_01_FULL_48_9]|nr:MAG: anthranilate/aminodeoxychorismate synthase component II [Omnitrophica WOR_2 bacterium RIFCSPHIGHO2_02_FULL_48_11]OGX34119.1 MAG: anthranilate/aminodeoxychorismate synthase component II [Omnitrophica WOR_2 bacterium RIFCSPHIGHO2_01_FULL_48_9]
MLLIIDNYDSFTYNLVQYFGELKARVVVYRNDALSLAQIKKLKPGRIVISPGPGRPEDAGISVDIIQDLAGKIPILGVCLGHQAIGYAYGGNIIHAKRLMHGKTSLIQHNRRDLFKGIKNPFEATRYHSLVIERKTLPHCLEITAWTKDKEIMGVRHKQFPLWGVQFHPESILTNAGKDILKNFLKLK